MLVTPSIKKLPNIKPIEKLSENNRRNIVFCISHSVYKENAKNFLQVVCTGRKFSYFVSMASSTLRNFPKFFALNFWQLSDALRRRLKFYINVQQGLKRFLNRLLNLSFYWVTITSIFRSSNTSFLSWMWLLYLK